MNFEAIAKEVLEKTGGKENLISAAHCATRLRLVISDNEKCNSRMVEKIEGVKGVFFASGQLQIIFGTGTVNKVYDEFVKAAGISETSKDDLKKMAASKANPFQRLIKTIGDIFVPIIPAIVASGFLMGLMEALNFMVNNNFLSINTEGSVYQFAVLFSNVAYIYLPILIAFSAAKVFGANPFLGAVIGMIMIHPDLQNAWTVATEGVERTQEVFFGLYKIDMVGYQGHVIPIIIAVFLLSIIEKKLHKVVPDMFDLFVTPLLSVFITAYLTLAAIGPVFVLIENSILNGVQWLIALPLGIGSFLMGGVYATTVVSGIHHMYTVIDIGQLAQYGVTFWLPLASAANMAQGAATLAVGLKTKDKKLKSMALPSSVSAFLGITEPAIFGVNLRYIRPFIAGSVGGACGALYAAIVSLGANGTGVTGIFGLLLHLHRPVQYIIAMGIAIGVSFGLTWLFGIKESAEEEEPAEMPLEAINKSADNSTEACVLKAPMTGKVVAIEDINDPIFSSGALGKGIAIEPESGIVTAPFDGIVTAVTDTRHAVGLTSENGTEVLIHIGMDTVNLSGAPFKVHVQNGDKVKMGDLLIEADIEQIVQAGLDIVTPVVVTNTDSFENVKIICGTQVARGQNILEVK